MKPDAIRIKLDDGVVELSLDDWKRLELDDRVDYLRRGEVQFLSGETPVPLEDALESLRSAE